MHDSSKERTLPTDASRATFRSFDESTPADWSVIVEQMDDFYAEVPDHILQQLRHLRDDQGGFPIDRLQHSLQTATRAERDGRDDEYVLCALLHDVGEGLAPTNHAAVAAAILAPFVSEANRWMLEHHTIFQGYYYWKHLGWDTNAREVFRSSPYFDHTEEFCAKFDQVSFDRDYATEPLEHFESLLRSFFVAHLTRPADLGTRQ